MNRQKKIGLLIAGGIVAIIACAGLVCTMMYVNTKTKIRLEIQNLPAFDEVAVTLAESRKLGFDRKPDVPNQRANEISAVCQKDAKVRADRQYSPDRVNRRIAADIAKLKLAKRGDNVELKLKNGGMLKGQIKKIVTDAAEIAVVTVDTLPVKVKSDLAVTDHYRFTPGGLVREKSLISAKYRREYEDDKERLIASIIRQLEDERMPKALYVKAGNDWLPAFMVVDRRVAEQFSAYNAKRDADIKRILESNPVFGHRFTEKDVIEGASAKR